MASGILFESTYKKNNDCPNNFFIKDIFIYQFEREQERKGGEKEQKKKYTIDLWPHLFLHSSVASYMSPDGGLNPHPWCIRKTL